MTRPEKKSNTTVFTCFPSETVDDDFVEECARLDVFELVLLVELRLVLLDELDLAFLDDLERVLLDDLERVLLDLVTTFSSLVLKRPEMMS